jgi:hypothetical protein
MKKLILIMMLGILLISMASAKIDLGSFKQGECAYIKQTCDTCTYVNLSSISRTGANATTWNLNAVMTKSNVDYSYTFCDIGIAGGFSVYGDKGGVLKTEDGIFAVTPSGNTGNEVFYLIIFVVIFGLGLGGFFAKNEIITLLGALPMMILGLYITINGITVYRDWITLPIAYISIGLGAYLGFMASYSLYEDL